MPSAIFGYRLPCSNGDSTVSDPSLSRSPTQSEFSQSSASPDQDDSTDIPDDVIGVETGTYQLDHAMLVDDKDIESDVEVWHDLSEAQHDRYYASAPDLLKRQQDLLQVQHEQPQAFRRWMSTLRRRNENHPPVTPMQAHTVLNDVDEIPKTFQAPIPADGHLRAESYASSLAFVTGMRSTSMTMTTMSMPSAYGHMSATSPRSIAHVMSNPTSFTDLRRSFDSESPSMAPALDEAALRRSQKRARKVQELLRTEEGFVSDLKCLQSVRLPIDPSHKHSF